MSIRFWKYHGTGNDFVMLLDVEDRAPVGADLAAAICDRRFGVGADGLIRVAPGDGPGRDFFMDYRNADGSLAEMCGNGIRCVAALVRHEGVSDRDALVIGTRDGAKHVTIDGRGREVRAVTVDMGPARMLRGEIGMTGPVDQPSRLEPVEREGLSCKATAVSMGNPHLVLFVEDHPDRVAVTEHGPALEVDPRFPQKTNVEFVAVRDGGLDVRVWERGVGETLACGTGACASFAAARDAGLVGDRATLRFPGGELACELAASGSILLTGPAERVAVGTLDDAWLAKRGLA